MLLFDFVVVKPPYLRYFPWACKPMRRATKQPNKLMFDQTFLLISVKYLSNTLRWYPLSEVSDIEGYWWKSLKNRCSYTHIKLYTTPYGWLSNIRADSMLASSQWETSLQCIGVSHYLGANLESALNFISTAPVASLQYNDNVYPQVNPSEFCLNIRARGGFSVKINTEIISYPMNVGKLQH